MSNIQQVSQKIYNKMKILLVEDNRDDVEIFLMMLGSEKKVQTIDVVHDGAQAIEFLFGNKNDNEDSENDYPDIIVLDIKMPKLNGIDVLKRIKDDTRTNVIPVIIFTSSNQQSDIERCYQLGANSYVVKPIDYSDYAKTIQSLGRYWTNFNVFPDR